MNKAKLYQRANGVQRRDAKQILDEFSHLFNWRYDGTDNLLDIGCGTGDVTIDFILPKLPKNFRQLIGCDISEQMIQCARQTYKQLKNINFEIFDITTNDDVIITFNGFFNKNNQINNNNNSQSDGNHRSNDEDEINENLIITNNQYYKNIKFINETNLLINNKRNFTFNYENNKNLFNNNKNNNKFNNYFDHITSFYCLHWIQNQRQAITNIYKLLKKNGGDCLLVFLANNPIYEIYQKLSKFKKWSKYMKDVQQFISPYQYCENPASEFGDLLYSIGFTEYNIEVRDNVFVYEGLDILKKSVKAVNPFLDRIPPELHDDYLDDYVNIVCNMHLCDIEDKTNEFTFPTPYKLIIAYARK